jgi:protein O-mannosyl-transferase
VKSESNTKSRESCSENVGGRHLLRVKVGICIFLAAIVWVVFGQTRNFDFVNFDDDKYVINNSAVTGGVTASGVAAAFGKSAMDNWVPLTTISHMVDCQFYGLKAGGHHLTNVLLQMAAAILLFLALQEMTGTIWQSAFVAAVFAVHPLRTESVAWISERKDVLCGLFFMLTLWTYARYVRSRSKMAWYLVTWFFAACALMSKPAAVTLPFVLLLLDYWPLRRFNSTALWRLAAEKIPFLALSLGSCLATMLMQKRVIVEAGIVPIPLRIENAIVSYVVYAWQLFCPMRLAVFYLYPTQGFPFLEMALAFLLLAAISLAVFYWRRKRPYLLVGWLWYLIMLVPVIGLVQVGSQAHADRYTYLPEIGLCLLLAWLVADFCMRLRWGRAALVGLAALILTTLIVGGHRQTSYWRNSGTLWAHAIDCDPNDIRARYDLGNYLDQKKDLDGAIVQYEDVIKVNPNHISAHNNLGMALSAKGDVADAIGQYREAIKLDPDYAIAHYNLGSALLERGQTDEAIQEFQDALSIDPARAEVRDNPDLSVSEQTATIMKTDYAQFHNGLGLAFAWKGEVAEAIVQYQEALKLNPYYLEAIYNLANALAKAGQVDGAVAAFQEAFKMDPGNAKQHNNLGTALRRLGRTDEAIAQYQKALKMDPSYAPAYYNLGNVLFQKGEIKEAIAEYEAALKAQPSNAMLQKNLAHAIWTLATSPDASQRNGTAAVEFAQTADQLAGGNNPVILRVLAAAYAESGNFPMAIETGKRAMAMAADGKNPELQNALHQEISLYQAGSAVRAEPANMAGW